MTVTELTRSRRTRSWSTDPPNPKSSPLVAADCDEGSSSLERQLIDHEKAKSCVIERADELKSHLDPQFPSFVKSIIISSVGSSLPSIPPDISNFLPTGYAMISLIDENEQIYTVKYLGEKDRRISAGWAHFSKEHKLVNGDALVFHLVKPTAFKVYIVRAYGMTDLDGIQGHLNVWTLQKQTDSGKRTMKIREVVSKNVPHNLPSAFLEKPRVSGINNKEVGLQVLEGTQFSKTTASGVYSDKARLRGCTYTNKKVAVDRNERSRSGETVLIEKAKMCAMEQAEEVKAHLDPQFPSFVKSVLPSYGGFWMDIPQRICRLLPKENVLISLIDENEEVYTVKYLSETGRLSGGWGRFSNEHKLVNGDALVFHLVKPTEFEVYVIRAYEMVDTDGISGHLNVSCKRTKKISEIADKKLPRKKKSAGLPRVGETSGLNGLEGTHSSETRVDFKDITSLESFTIVVNGSVIDPLLTEEEGSKYYELCCSQKCFLHANLLDGINSRLTAGIISQTVSIADAIRGTKLFSSEEELVAWGKKLDAFDLLGMNVAFLQTQVKTLANLLLESEEIMNSGTYE